MSPFPFRGGRALITGGSAGLGEAFAEALAARGMDLVLTARREERLREVAGRLQSRHSVRASVVAADLADPAAADGLWQAALEDGPVDLLVNNAGFGAQGPFADVDLETQARMVEVNCTALLRLAHHALRSMRERGAPGGVVNVSSLAAFQPVPRMATYAATKAFVLSFSEALAEECRGTQIRVVALCPGRTPTEFQEIAGTGDARGAFGERSPEQIVRAGLEALDAGRTYVVPGVENYLASWASRIVPRPTVARVLKRLIRRRSAGRS